ncbi:MAG: hypothetical protein KBT28_01520 [Bacteroidales bacterium]|nr:hypothetical protein [Candidatus Colimorpha merdihippi]
MTLKVVNKIKWKVSDEELKAAGVSKEKVEHAIKVPLLMRVTEGEPPIMIDDLYDGTKVAFAYTNADDSELHLVYGSVTMTDNPEEPKYWEPDRNTLHKMFAKDHPKIRHRVNQWLAEAGWPVESWSIKCDYFAACIVNGEGLDTRVHRNIEFPDVL